MSIILIVKFGFTTMNFKHRIFFNLSRIFETGKENVKIYNLSDHKSRFAV